GVAVLSTPTANARAVCEYVFSLIFALGRPVVNLKEPISDEAFHDYRKKIRGLELSGKTMAIMGMGRIGRGVGKIAWAMEMNVIYNDLVDMSNYINYPAKAVSKAELYEKADILTVHVDHQPNNLNFHMANGSVFSKMER